MAEENIITIRCRKDGPLVLPAGIRIIDHLGNEFVTGGARDNIALCRCGQSKTKPFCDGSHRACGFEASETAAVPPQSGA